MTTNILLSCSCFAKRKSLSPFNHNPCIWISRHEWEYYQELLAPTWSPSCRSNEFFASNLSPLNSLIERAWNALQYPDTVSLKWKFINHRHTCSKTWSYTYLFVSGSGNLVLFTNKIEVMSNMGKKLHWIYLPANKGDTRNPAEDWRCVLWVHIVSPKNYENCHKRGPKSQGSLGCRCKSTHGQPHGRCCKSFSCHHPWERHKSAHRILKQALWRLGYMIKLPMKLHDLRWQVAHGSCTIKDQ